MEIPVWEKYILSVEEAAEYFHIGINRLRQMAKRNPNAEWVIWTGTHMSIKRKLFEKMIDNTNAV